MTIFSTFRYVNLNLSGLIVQVSVNLSLSMLWIAQFFQSGFYRVNLIVQIEKCPIYQSCVLGSANVLHYLPSALPIAMLIVILSSGFKKKPLCQVASFNGIDACREEGSFIISVEHSNTAADTFDRRVRKRSKHASLFTSINKMPEIIFIFPIQHFLLDSRSWSLPYHSISR